MGLHLFLRCVSVSLCNFQPIFDGQGYKIYCVFLDLIKTKQLAYPPLFMLYIVVDCVNGELNSRLFELKLEKIISSSRWISNHFFKVGIMLELGYLFECSSSMFV